MRWVRRTDEAILSDMSSISLFTSDNAQLHLRRIQIQEVSRYREGSWEEEKDVEDERTSKSNPNVGRPNHHSPMHWHPSPIRQAWGWRA